MHSPHDAEGMYDVLTYEKGAAVLRMLEQYLGADEFRAGMRAYLSKHAYGNTENTDLWDAIEAATSEPARRIMDAWIFQGGYPLVRVSPGPDGQSARLTQRRFVYSDMADTTQWPVPLHIRQSAGGETTNTRLLLDSEHEDMLLAAPDAVVARERRWPRLPPRSLRGAFPRSARGAGPRRDVHDRALQPGRRRLGRGAWPVRRRRRSTSTSRGASATSRRCQCGRPCPRVWASATG